MDDGAIEVELVRDGGPALPEDEPAAAGAVDWRRWLVAACAVVVAACAALVAHSQLRISRAAERQTCMFEVQFSTSFRGPREEDEYLDRLRACGVEVPEDDDSSD